MVYFQRNTLGYLSIATGQQFCREPRGDTLPSKFKKNRKKKNKTENYPYKYAREERSAWKKKQKEKRRKNEKRN